MGSCSDPDRKTIAHGGLAIHITANVHRPGAVLHCMYSITFRPELCCTSPSVPGRLRRVMITEKPAGSSHSVLPITHLHGLAFI